MKILIDMNLSPEWCAALEKHGHSCVHWSQIGSPDASDSVLMEWARQNGYVVLTHDLDFGAILAATKASAPSVIQIRARDVLPPAMEAVLASALRTYEDRLSAGALLVVDSARSRARILPLSR
jgi:predicted nuclease of predicted toxin-antitoxin system